MQNYNDVILLSRVCIGKNMILTIFNVVVKESMNVLLISVKKVNGQQSFLESENLKT